MKKKSGEDTTEIAKHYADFNALEDNIEWNGHKANIVNPVFYKIFLGEFY